MVVDDHEVVRRGVVDVLDSVDGLSVVAEAAGVEEALTRSRATRPDLVVVDLRLPDGDGIELIARLRKLNPNPRCVVLTSFDDDEALRAAYEAGAAAFLLKTVRGAELANAVKQVAAGRRLLDERSVKRTVKHSPLASLTTTERRVLNLIGDGHSNREIGKELGIAEKTVKNHVTALMAKLGFSRRTQAAAWVASHRAGTWG
jgi:DNA-binding NarL/FixJ family response regulator